MTRTDASADGLEALAARAAGRVFRPVPDNVVSFAAGRRKRLPPSRAWLRENGYLPPVRVLLAVPVKPDVA